MAVLILAVGEKLEDLVVINESKNEDAKSGSIKLEDIEVILQSKRCGETILQGPFKELNEAIDETDDNIAYGEHEDEGEEE